MEATTQYFGKGFYKQVLEFHCPSKFLCLTSGRQNHWSLVRRESANPQLTVYQIYCHSLLSHSTFPSTWGILCEEQDCDIHTRHIYAEQDLAKIPTLILDYLSFKNYCQFEV
jgi:hypothetical protein